MNKTDILHVKCVLLGESNIGKTSLITRYFYNKFHNVCESTIGCSFNNKIYSINGKTYHLDVWDTAGQEKYRGLMPMYYRNTDIVFICIDLSEITTKYIDESFYYWEKQLESYCNNGEKIVVLVGTKLDKKSDTITDEYIENLCSKNNLEYFETSAKTDTGINELFERVVNRAIVKVESKRKERMEFEEKLNLDGGGNVTYSKGCC